MSNYLDDEKSVRNTADALLGDTKLLNLLAPYGAVSIGGAYAYKLMVDKDIDLHLCVRDLSSDSRIALRQRITSTLLAVVNVHKLKVVDFVATPPPPGKLRGFWFGLTLLYNNEEWNIDLWATTVEDKDAPQAIHLSPTVQHQLEHLDDAMRLTILRLKHYLRSHHPHTFRSVAVYEAVIEHQMTNPGQLEAFLFTRYGAQRKTS